jgi:hypothetical protein
MATPPPPLQLQPAGQVNSGGGLPDPALLVQDCDQQGMTY